MITLTQDDLKWARKIVWSIANSYPYLKEDIQSEAYVALHRAATAFLPGKGEFRDFAYRRITGAALDFLRTQNRDIRNAALRNRDAIKTIHIEPEEWNRFQAQEHDLIDLLEMHKRNLWLRETIKSLPSWDARFLTMRLFQNMTLAEIGKKLGFSEARACQIMAKLENQILTRAKKDGLIAEA